MSDLSRSNAGSAPICPEPCSARMPSKAHRPRGVTRRLRPRFGRNACRFEEARIQHDRPWAMG